MPATPSTDVVGVAKAGLLERYETLVDDEVLKLVDDVEPREAKKLPAVTIMFRGFGRAALGQSNISGQPLRDPLGGRQWVLYFTVRIWVALRSDERASQYELDDLVPKVVRALEEDRSLGARVDDSAMASGDTAIVRPRSGQPMFMLTCDTAVDLTEET